MAIPLFLALTSAEFAAAQTFPEQIAWMSCYFSSNGTDLSGLPSALPPGALLILNDQIPICGHDPMRIAEQLQQTVDGLDCCGVLLDFQRSGEQEAAILAAQLVSRLPCPVAVSDLYAEHLDCPVFLSPCPHHVPLSEHLSPWKGRQLWLDLAADAESITITNAGSQILPFPPDEVPESGHGENLLHCHYFIETGTEFVRFTLWRTQEDIAALAAEADALGIAALIGLNGELGVKHAK